MLTRTLIVMILSLFIATVYSQSEPLQGDQDMQNLLITMLDGKTVQLKNYKGKKPVYLKFWASWCQPCREQMPHLQKTFVDYGDKIQIIAVNIDINDSLEAIESIKNEYALTVPIAIDSSGELSQAVNIIGTPYHILMDSAGTIVFKGHDASPQLDKTIQALTTKGTHGLPGQSLELVNDRPILVADKKSQYSALFFTSTWCDWYLKESRPEMSANCINAQKQINALFTTHPDIHWVGIISRLWTGDKELNDYKSKYQIEHTLVIDTSNKEFMKYHVKTFPTLILLHNNEEIFRTSDFSSTSKISGVVRDFKKQD